MADMTEAYKILLEAKTDEVDDAKKKVDQFADQIVALNAAMKASGGPNAQYRADLGKLAAQAQAARTELSRLGDEARDLARQGNVKAPRIEGADRVGAKARLGLAGANILQDAIQGGPASTINNILGLAGDGGIKALGAEFVGAAGGAAALGAALTTVGAVAGAAFLVIDGGLKSAKLGWGDLGSVVDQIAGGAFSAAAKNTESTLGSVSSSLGSLVGSIADATIGWGDATTAVRDHKDELDRATRAAQGLAEAEKAIGRLQSDAQRESKGRGGAFGAEVANLAGGDVNDLIDRIVTSRMGTGDGKVVGNVPILDDKGQPTGKERDVNEREQMAGTLKQILAGATERGEQGSMQAIVRALGGLGLDTTKLEGTAGLAESDAEKSFYDKRDRDEADRRARAGMAEAEKAAADDKKRAAELAGPMQDRYNLTSASGGVVTEGQVRRNLEGAGVDKAEADRLAGKVLADLDAGFREAIRQRAGKLGTDTEGAKGSIVGEAAEGAERDRSAARKALGLDKDEKRTSQVFNDAASFRDSIQGALGAKDDTPQLSLRVQQQTQETLQKANELLLTISKKVGGPARAG